MKSQRLWISAMASGAFLTVVVLALPSVRYAYHSPEGHVTLQAVEASIAFLAAYLLYGRFRDDGRLRHLLLVYALGILAVTNLSSVLAIHVVSGNELIWGSLMSRILGAISLMTASIVRRDRISGYRPKGFVVAAMCLLIVPLIKVTSLLIGPLPGPLQIDVTMISFGRPLITGHPMLIAGQLSLLVLHATAAIGFIRQSQRQPDELLRYLGSGCILSALARLNYSLFPSLYTEFIYSGDILRLGFYLFVLAGATSEIRTYWRRLEDANRELETLALQDSLTGLYNRLGFTNHGEQELKLARRAGLPIALIFIDVNDMKEINDQFGHEKGDAALIEVAEVMRESFRDSDILARLGGDEFVVMMVATKEESLLAEGRLLSGLRSRDARQEKPWNVSVSTGVSIFNPDLHPSLQSLLDDADQLMYEHKHRKGMKPRILAVDDDPDMRLLLSNLLSPLYEVKTAASAKEALESMAKDVPDLILLDHVLPDASGISIVPQIRAKLGQRIRILMVTGRPEPEVESESLRTGADDHLIKPFESDVLLARIERQLQRGKRA